MDTEKWMIEKFLFDEGSHIDADVGVLDFIENDCIRSGEYEGNTYLLKKMDPINFLLYQEFIFPDGHREPFHCLPLHKDDLVAVIKNVKSEWEELKWNRPKR